MRERPGHPLDVVVSVVIPSFNHATYVVEAIDSALGQSFREFELLVIDDGSTDASVEIIRRHLAEVTTDVPVTLLSRENRGLCRTLNEGIRLARGKYFAALASDDLWEPRKLERQVAAMEEAGPRVGACFAECWIIDGEGRRMGRWGRSREFPYRGGDIYVDIATLRFLPNVPTTIFLRSAVEEVGGYNEARRVVEDQDLWLRVARRYEVVYLREPLASYRVHGENVSTLRADALLDDLADTVREALDRDESLAPFERVTRGRLEARRAAASFNALRLSDARRNAVAALRLSPTDRLAWTILIRSVLGARAVALLRGVRAARRQAGLGRHGT